DRLGAHRGGGAAAGRGERARAARRGGARRRRRRDRADPRGRLRARLPLRRTTGPAGPGRARRGLAARVRRDPRDAALRRPRCRGRARGPRPRAVDAAGRSARPRGHQRAHRRRAREPRQRAGRPDGHPGQRRAGGADGFGARARLPGRVPAGRGLPPWADGDGVLVVARRAGAVRRAPRARARLHAGVRPLQHRPPHLRERPVVRRPARRGRRRVAVRRADDRARRPLDGRARPAQRVPPGSARGRGVGLRCRPRGLARLAAHGSAARAGGALRQRRAPQAAGDPAVRRVPAPAQRGDPRPAPRLARRRRLARLRSRRAAGKRRRRGPAAGGSDALLRGGDDHAVTAPSPRPAARRHPRAAAVGLGPQPVAPPGLRGRVRAPVGRHDPLRAAQPPGGVREAVRVARGGQARRAAL
ncbi:MAG: FIG00998106: hypothetical protein, partial [uncultured Solirubrobacteraceae bacterium]